MKILALTCLGIIIYLLIGIMVSLIDYLLSVRAQKNPGGYDAPELIILLWPLFLIMMILVGILMDIPAALYNKMIDKIDLSVQDVQVFRRKRAEFCLFVCIFFII